jgi:hypothetical protein
MSKREIQVWKVVSGAVVMLAVAVAVAVTMIQGPTPNNAGIFRLEGKEGLQWRDTECEIPTNQ